MYSIIIPVHNEEHNIVILLQEILSVMAKDRFEVIVIDDASTDYTLQQLQTAKRNMPFLRIVKHDKKMGQSAGLRSGITASRYPIIITLDGDGQNDPHDIPKMLDVYHNHLGHLGLVIGHRVNRHDTKSRTIASKIANYIRGNFLKDFTPDTGCGLKVFRKDVFLQLPYFNHIHRFFPALLSSLKFEIISVPVNHRHRQMGESKYTNWQRFKVGVWDLFGVKWLQHRLQLLAKSEEV
jgi:dolichol-phosphate mannosyltransferase